ncbi:MAG: caspase family protein, partial [Nitrospirae bacterium]|nr:caspase family protein [Nitrospirota bacterium]
MIIKANLPPYASYTITAYSAQLHAYKQGVDTSARPLDTKKPRISVQEKQDGKIAQSALLNQKVRVFIMTYSEISRWARSDEWFVENTYENMAKILSDKGMYEIVPRNELEKALTGKIVSQYNLEKDNYALAKKIGKVVYADFMLIAERNRQQGTSIYYTFVNLETEKKYVSGRGSFMGAASPSETDNIINEVFADINDKTKAELQAVAMRKSGRIAELAKTEKAPDDKAATVLAEKLKEKAMQERLAAQKDLSDELSNLSKELASKKAENERLAKLLEEQKRLDAERAEKEKEKAEQTKLALQKEAQAQAERERLAIQQKERAEQERIAAERAISEKFAREKAENERLRIDANYYAIIIGNNNYKYLPKLNTSVSDATEMDRVLKNKYGFSVTSQVTETNSIPDNRDHH